MSDNKEKDLKRLRLYFNQMKDDLLKSERSPDDMIEIHNAEFEPFISSNYFLGNYEPDMNAAETLTLCKVYLELIVEEAKSKKSKKKEKKKSKPKTPTNPSPPSTASFSEELRNTDMGLTVNPTDIPDTINEVCQTFEQEVQLVEHISPEDGGDLDNSFQPRQMTYSERHPYLPNKRCPFNLWVSTLNPSYLESVYRTSPEVFPAQWESLIREDPIQAWNSLNLSLREHYNKKWNLDLGTVETAIDFYNVTALQNMIKETIEKAMKSSPEQSTTPGRRPTSIQDPIETKLSPCLLRLEEAVRTLTSHTVKVTGKEVTKQVDHKNIGPTLGGIVQSSHHLVPKASCPRKRRGSDETPI